MAIRQKNQGTNPTETEQVPSKGKTQVPVNIP